MRKELAVGFKSMVSFESCFSLHSDSTKKVYMHNKRKWEQQEGDEPRETKHLREDCEGEGTGVIDVGLHLQTPVIFMDSHRCLNLHAREKACKREQSHLITITRPSLSLDLELKVPDATNSRNISCRGSLEGHSSSEFVLSTKEEDKKEKGAEKMVAAVCMQCHMLVMLCKSSPTCPNCKFFHPSVHDPFKLGLLVCGDQ